MPLPWKNEFLALTAGRANFERPAVDKVQFPGLSRSQSLPLKRMGRRFLIRRPIPSVFRAEASSSGGPEVPTAPRLRYWIHRRVRRRGEFAWSSEFAVGLWLAWHAGPDPQL